MSDGKRIRPSYEYRTHHWLDDEVYKSCLKEKTSNDEDNSVINRLEEAKQIHLGKDEDYGDAWRQVGHTMWRMAGEEPIVLESPNDINSIGLYWERLIKLYRGFNGEFVSDELKYESVEDAHADNINYAAMHSTLRDE